MDYLITVIIPVFNCQEYLNQSIRSLLNQTIFEKIEFVFIDDGSTDDSCNIIREYQKNNKNFILIHQDNKGVSAARNVGLKTATSPFISFFDADDIAMPYLYETLYHLITESDADVSIVDYSMVFDDGTEKKHRINTRRTWSNSESAIIEFFTSNMICTNPVDKLFKAEIAKRISFPEGYAIGEDMYYIYNVLKECNTVVMDSNKSLYKYIMHSTSAMKQKFSKKHFDAVKLAAAIVDDCCNSKKLFGYAYANYIHEICKMLELMYRNNVEKEYSDFEKKYMRELRRYKFSEAKIYMSKKHFFAFVLMRLSPKLYCVIYKMLKIG